jgi:RNA polymerase primary sigma factor
LLSRAQEAELGRRIRDGDAEALQQLVCSNLRFVVSIAKRYRHHGVPLADLIDEGNLGLIRAAGRYDEARGAKFISYAVWWVRQSIMQAIADYGHAVRVPLSRAGTLYRIGKHANSLRQGLGREPRADEIADDLGMSDEELSLTLPISRRALSLDAPVGDDETMTLLDYIPDDAGAPPDGDATAGNLADSLDLALAALPPREANVLRMYFGFDRGDPVTLERIGEKFGVTRERVRQIKDHALWRIRNSAAAPTLASFREK